MQCVSLSRAEENASAAPQRARTFSAERASRNSFGLMAMRAGRTVAGLADIWRGRVCQCMQGYITASLKTRGAPRGIWKLFPADGRARRQAGSLRLSARDLSGLCRWSWLGYV